MAEKTFGETLVKIKGLPLGDLDEQSTKLGAILPLLGQAGWDTANPTEVRPELLVQSPKSRRKQWVDYALMVGGEVRILVEAKKWNSPLREGEENQLAGYCRRIKPNLAVLTSGNRWLLYLPPKGGKDDAELQLFLEFDIVSLEPDKVRENFERFLAKDRFKTKTSSAKVVKEAEVLLARLQDREAAFQSMTAAWNSLTNESQALVDLIQSVTEPRPDEELAREFLNWVQKPLVNTVAAPSGNNPVAQYITYHLEGETHGPVRVKRSAWHYALDDVCRLMQELHPDTLDLVLDIKGFAKSREELKSPIDMASVGLYFNYPGGATGYRKACADVLAKFGYSSDCLTVRVKGCMESPVWPPP